MPKFKPTHFFSVCYSCSLGISITQEDGDSVVLSAFYNEHGEKSSKVVKSLVRVDRNDALYFIRGRQKYYLCDFVSNILY